MQYGYLEETKQQMIAILNKLDGRSVEFSEDESALMAVNVGPGASCGLVKIALINDRLTFINDDGAHFEAHLIHLDGGEDYPGHALEIVHGFLIRKTL